MLRGRNYLQKHFKANFSFHNQMPLEFSVKRAQDLSEFNRASFFPNKMEVMAYLFFYFFIFFIFYLFF